MGAISAAASYSLGYTKPSNLQLGFRGDHEAAFVIQSSFRTFRTKRNVSRALMAAVEEGNQRRHAGAAVPAPAPTNALWTLLNEPSSSWLAWLLTIFMLVVIVCSCATFVLETLPSVHGRHKDIFLGIEMTCVIFFTIEFVLRLGSCPALVPFCKDFLNWIDLASIIPFYIERTLDNNAADGLATLRLIRLVRVFRLLKLGRHSAALQVYAGTLRQSVRPMTTLIMFVVCGVVIIASIMYYVERGKFACPCGRTDDKWCSDGVECVNATETGYWVIQVGDQPPAKSGFQDIPSTMYFALVTMTTVGYGDVKPVTALGQMLASCFCVFGVVIIALPISVISANFKTLFFEAEQKKQEGAGMAAEDEVRVRSRCLPRSHPWVVSPTAY
jgi:hypothetical protein